MLRSRALYLALGLVATAASPALAATPGKTGYYTYHYDNGRTGWNPSETTLTTKSVASSRFGLVRTLAADSVVYAQPLYVPNVTVGGVNHNLAILATENDSVYAYDADTGALVWKRSFIAPSRGITAVSIQSVGGCGQITPTIGISSTPVVDATTGTLYVVDKIQITSGGSTTYHNRLHALDLRGGADRLTPTEIAGSVHINGGGTDVFADQWQQNRAGLVLANGNVYVGFGSSCDENASITHGWLFAYDRHTLKNTAIFNTTTTSAADYLGAIWQATYAPAADAAGHLYFATGNGAFDANTGGSDFGEAVLRLDRSLHVADYFSPHDELVQSNNDQDLGSNGVMLVPGTNPQVAIAGIKSGTMYVLNAGNLGGFHASDRIYQRVVIENVADSMFGGPAYYAGFVYWGASGLPVQAYAVTTSPAPHLSLKSRTPNTFNGEGSAIPGISSNGTTPGTAILWAMTGPSTGNSIVLYAYDATNLSRMLYSGKAGVWRAQAGAFLTPTIADGHVFVGGAGYSVAEFGLR